MLTSCLLNLAEAEQRKQIILGKANLGGEWELMDHTGQMRKSSDFHGKWVIIYFGFTHCPDICPDEIEKMVEAVDKLGRILETKFCTIDLSLRVLIVASQKIMATIFFSQTKSRRLAEWCRSSSPSIRTVIRPRRLQNTSKVRTSTMLPQRVDVLGWLNELCPRVLTKNCCFLAEFSPKIIGFTGTNEQLRQATRAYRVYFSEGPKDDDNDYIVSISCSDFSCNTRSA